jgi:triphosphoribosyl-dephospho-CoA synthase
LAPLAGVDDGQSHEDHISDVLAALDAEDTKYVYEAIRLAHPGGLGDSDRADVRDNPPPLPLVEVMRLAADRDHVSRQYVSGFETVFHEVADPLVQCMERGWDLLDAIVYVEISLIARNGDSLIGRKCGQAVADQARNLARPLLATIDAATGKPFASVEVKRQLAAFDQWLRADGNRRNPGTTADLIAAGLFVLLREGRLDAAAARAAIAAARGAALPNKCPS